MYEEDLFSGYDPYKGMTDEERMRACLLHVISTAVGVIIVIIACALLGGCTTTKYVPVVEHHTDTLIHTQHQRDSIYVHDSTYVRDNGDTVLIERWHTRWRDRWQHDTLYISKTDSVPKPYPVEVVKEVPRERSTVEWVLLITGIVAITFIVLSILIWVKKHT
jgi:hypothetical protein